GVFLQPLDVFGQRIDRGWPVGVAAAGDRGAGRRAALAADTPFVDRRTVRNAFVAGTGHRQPGIGEAPAERGILLAVIHMAVNAYAVDRLHRVGEEVGDV